MSNQLAWDEWRTITQEIYLRKLKGWPAAEMKRYWEQGMSPLTALETATRRRKPSARNGRQT